LVGRLADATPHPDLWYAPFVVVCFVLPAWYAVGWRPVAWERVPLLLLAIQAILTFVPLAVFGQHWVGGVDGLLGGLALAVLPRRVSWWVFAALASIELGAWLAVGVPYQPTYHAAIWLMVAYATFALGYFGLSAAGRLLERLESTAELLADAAVDRQRLATAEGLQATIVRRLDAIQLHAAAALTAKSGDATIGELRLVGEAARGAAASARRIVSAISEPAIPAEGESSATPAFAQRIVGAVVTLYAVQFIMNTVFPVPGGASATLITNLAAIAIATAIVVIQLHHSRLPRGAHPRRWVWTLAAQFVLCFALYPLFGVVALGLIPFVCGSVLLLFTHPARWALAGAMVASLPILTQLAPSDISGEPFQIQWSIYAAAVEASATLVIYGLGRFVRAAAALADARRLLAETAVTRERVRIARDTHDTLGLSLSAIALKSDLAQALLSRDAARARREIVQTIHLSRTVAADADSIVRGTLRLNLAAELDSARNALDAAGITVTVEREPFEVTAAVETELAAILREAVANVLRHSDAHSCSIRVTARGELLELEVVNDGARDSAGTTLAGRGLDNIRDRAAALGGTATVTDIHGTFTLAARLPRTELAVAP
jgi:two-component system sensor histidine kinase DesK